MDPTSTLSDAMGWLAMQAKCPVCSLTFSLESQARYPLVGKPVAVLPPGSNTFHMPSHGKTSAMECPGGGKQYRIKARP